MATTRVLEGSLDESGRREAEVKAQELAHSMRSIGHSVGLQRTEQVRRPLKKLGDSRFPSGVLRLSELVVAPIGMGGSEKSARGI